jgi:hypothetical protein
LDFSSTWKVAIFGKYAKQGESDGESPTYYHGHEKKQDYKIS